MRRLGLRAVRTALAAPILLVSCGSDSTPGASAIGRRAPDASSSTISGPSGSDGAASAMPDGATQSTQQDDAAGDAQPLVAPQPVSPFIVVDQFGYRPSAEKVAVLRNPQVGFDSSMHFTPGATYALVDAHAGNSTVFEGSPSAWNSGATDGSSGDQAWWFDFSSVTAPGEYYVL
ncbi:MAG TPA: cellulase N-terminal Ig-like domain-containing protein, partial [Polyangiaceae bacterium]|nr:cellulase N-terminal Ig-like domain-containing protein [Polyangiaceae bacterium]